MAEAVTSRPTLQRGTIEVAREFLRGVRYRPPHRVVDLHCGQGLWVKVQMGTVRRPLSLFAGLRARWTIARGDAEAARRRRRDPARWSR